jgi:hypothetical protein
MQRNLKSELTLGVALLLSLFVAPANAAQICTTQTVGDEEFRGISGSSDSNVIGVGKKGEIHRFDGSSWSQMASPTNKDLNDVEVLNSSTAFAVGRDGTVLQLSGGTWTSIGGMTNEDLFGVWAASTTEVYAVGKKGEIWRYDGSSWFDESAAAGTSNKDLEDAWGDANSFYAVNDDGVLYRRDLSTGNWTTDTACTVGDKFEDLWGDGNGNIYLVGKKNIHRYNGSSCPVVATVDEDLRGIYGSSVTGEIYAGGKKGLVAEFNGVTWQETNPADEEIKDVWVSQAGNAYYAGKKAEITTCEVIVPNLIADWQLDDCTLGFDGSAVIDSGPNSLDGTSVGGLDVQNDGQLCSAGDFNGSSSYVSVPDTAALDIRDGFSVAVWVRHDGSLLKDWEAILAKGDSAYRLHLNGGCGIADTLPGNTRHGFTLGLNGGCAGADLNSNIVPVPGTWYHVAATYDRSTMHMYVNGNLVNSASYTAAINANNFDLFIGENSQNRNRYWSGDIDELSIWDNAITPQQVIDHRDRTRPCTNCGGVEFVINHDNNGINCLAETITVDVVDSIAGTPRTDYIAGITLDTQTGNGTWTLVSGGGTLVDATADDGLATYDWPAGESTAEFALSYTNGTASFNIDVYQTDDTATRDDDSEGDITFSPNGFTLTANALGNPPPALISVFSATQVAGTDFPIHIAAFGQTPNDPTCGIIESYTGPKNLKFWFDHINPGSGSVPPTIDTVAIPALGASAADQPVTFTNGQAAVTGKYKDVGRIQINVTDDSQPHPDLPNGIRGATAGFVVKPFQFALTNIEDGSGNANPAAVDANGGAFVAAGETFSITVSALDAEGDVTPNYGQEAIAETVALTSNLVAPPAGDNPALASGFGAFVAGQATGVNFSWPEVGIITLTPSVGDGDYLGAGDVSGAASGNVGRFYAHHFTTSLNTPTFATTCAAGSFSYIGETFGYSNPPVITLTARALAGEVAENYVGGFFKIDSSSLSAPLYTATPATLDSSGLPAGDPIIAETGAGTGTLTFGSGAGLFYTRGTEEAPFDADIRLSIDVADTDGAAASNPVEFGSAGGMLFDSGSEMRYGRGRVLNAYGSELVNLAMPFRTEYFVNAATGFVQNVDDSCTSPVTLSFITFTDNLAAGETCVFDTGAPGSSGAGCAAPGPLALRYRTPPLGGDFNLHLQAPGDNNDGSTTIRADVPDWLEFDWDSTLPGLEDPTGTAVFGIFSGSDRRIYIRELY